MNDPDIIDNWEIVNLYSSALKKCAWIETICLGYTMLEMELTYLLKSKAGQTSQPVSNTKIKDCNYLIELAAMARDEGFISGDLFNDIESFNKSRINAIHKLLSGNVTKSELEETAKSIGKLSYSIQNIWLPIKAGKPEPAQNNG